MTMAMAALSREQIFRAAKPTDWDLGLGRTVVGFALSLLGHALDFTGAAVLRMLNTRLELDTFTLRGLRATVNELNGCWVLDADGAAARLLQELEIKVVQLRRSAGKAETYGHLKRTRNELARTGTLCVSLHE